MVTVADVYRHFAEVEAPPLSTHYALLAKAVVADRPLCDRIAQLPPRCWQPNLLLGAVRLHIGHIAGDGEEFVRLAHAHWPEVSAIMRRRFTQTNEVARCGALLPALNRIPGPLALIEVGCSAGLNLLLDRYHYRYGEVSVGVPGSPVQIDIEVRPGAPVPGGLPEIAWRRGIELNPIDLENTEDVRWLQALIWPGRPQRAGRLAAAIELARTDPPPVSPGDLFDLLPEVVAQVPAGATPVVMHSAVLYYLGERQQEFIDLVRESGARRVALEGGNGVQSQVTLDDEVVASADAHANWLGGP
ncbi:DUF2332 domain-containing protein [Pseudonocardiaceae bacterium YIM PH 21723]|nr:DUF2332 domain-containing protein [Pseudonocardiaceae bacterium YIM PH 21723]